MKASVPSPKYGWEDITRASVGIIHSLEEDGDIGLAFCFRNKPFRCSVTDVENVPAFEVGQEIHIMPSVTQPRLGWSNESLATVGRIDKIDMDGALSVSGYSFILSVVFQRKWQCLVFSNSICSKVEALIIFSLSYAGESHWSSRPVESFSRRCRTTSGFRSR